LPKGQLLLGNPVANLAATRCRYLDIVEIEAAGREPNRQPGRQPGREPGMAYSGSWKQTWSQTRTNYALHEIVIYLIQRQSVDINKTLNSKFS